MHRGVSSIANEGFRPCRKKERIKPALHCQCFRPLLAEVALERRIHLHIVRIIQKQVQLNIDIPGPRDQRRVQCVAFRLHNLGMRPLNVLLPDRLRTQRGAQGVAVLRGPDRANIAGSVTTRHRALPHTRFRSA